MNALPPQLPALLVFPRNRPTPAYSLLRGRTEPA